MSKIKAVEARLYGNVQEAKNIIASTQTRKLRIEKILRKWRLYSLNKGSSVFVQNHINRLEKDWAELNRIYCAQIRVRDCNSAAFCRIREVRRGNSTASLESILLGLVGL